MAQISKKGEQSAMYQINLKQEKKATTQLTGRQRASGRGQSKMEEKEKKRF